MSRFEITMMWKSWYGNEPLTIWLPGTWDTSMVRLKEAPAISDEEIRESLATPIGSPPLRKAVSGKRTVCIAVDDLTKPTEAYRLVPPILEELVAGGVKEEEIYFVISLGTHRPLTLGDFCKKLGNKIARSYRIYNHCAYQNNQYLGTTSKGTPVYINKLFLAADFKIGVGMLMPHNLAGFSGGGKIVFPGLASIESVDQNHQSTLRGLQSEIGTLRGNQVREDIDEAARMAGLDFIVNSVHNERGETIKVFCGDLTKGYEKAVSSAVEYYSCAVPYNNDIGIFNAFPRDNWFLLSLNSVDVWSTRNPEKQIVREGGTIVIINHCSEGAGEHGLMIKGMRHYVYRDEHGTFKEILKNRHLIFFSPNIHPGIIRDYYKKDAMVCSNWDEVVAQLRIDHGEHSQVAVFPSSTLQMDASVVD